MRGWGLGHQTFVGGEVVSRLGREEKTWQEREQVGSKVGRHES